MLLETAVAEPSLVGELDNVKVPIIRLINPARSFRAQRRALREICAQLAPDVLHTHGYLPDVLAASLRLQVGFARVSTVHGFTGGGWRNRLYEWMQRRSYFRFDAVVAVSRTLARELTPRLWGRIPFTVVNAWTPVGEALPREAALESLGLSGEAFNVGWVGRISREKGLDVLIESLSELGDLPIQLAVLGDGAQRSELQQRGRDLRLQSRISWCGAMERASQFLAAFDLFVISSRTEGTPITLFEAVHARVPIVATEVGGVPDVVSRNEAVLVAPDDPRALASAIRQVHAAPREAAERAGKARDRLDKEFAGEPWLAAYERIYRDTSATHRNR